MLILYTHWQFFFLEFNEHVRNIHGKMLLKNGYIKDIPKLINVFLMINIWVFKYTAPNEDNKTQRNKRNKDPNIKNIKYLIIIC